MLADDDLPEIVSVVSYGLNSNISICNHLWLQRSTVTSGYNTVNRIKQQLIDFDFSHMLTNASISDDLIYIIKEKISKDSRMF